jgi:choline dehydrogenase-like flavoprotein
MEPGERLNLLGKAHDLTGVVGVHHGDALGTSSVEHAERSLATLARANRNFALTPNNQVPRQKLYDKLKSMLGHMGLHPGHLILHDLYMKTEISIAGCAHQAGTCGFGNDPETSVLDVNCKAHELDNLRGRYELFRQHRRGESVADRDCQRHPRRRVPAAAAHVSGEE